MSTRLIAPGLALALALSLSACMSNGSSIDLSSAGGSDTAGAPAPAPAPAPTTVSQPPAPAPNPAPTPTGTPRSYTTGALVFAGNGTWGSEVTSIEDVLTSHNTTYREVNSAELDAMTPDQLTQFGTLIFPGGSGGTEADSLSSTTHANLRAAVQKDGVGYVGFCAGAFIGEAPAPAPGGDVSYGLGIVDGPILNDYYLTNQGVDYQMTLQSFPDGTTEDILWYGGPVTPNQGVIAKYPDGEPAISQIWSGKGLVILSGGHPTANQAILNALGLTSTDGTHLDLVWKLFDAVIQQKPLPTF